MNETGRARWARAASWALAAAVLLFAALLIAQCVSIYRAGTAAENMTEAGVRICDIYSREIVAERFGRIAWSFWLLIASLIAALILRRPEREALTAPVGYQLAMRLKRVGKTPAMRAEEVKRGIVTALMGLGCLFCAAMTLRALRAPGRFASTDLEMVVPKLVGDVLPFTALAIAFLMAGAQLRHVSMKKEIALSKDAPKRDMEPAKPSKPIVKNVARAALLVAAAALIAAGVRNGGMFDVLVKAINICTECIGLG